MLKTNSSQAGGIEGQGEERRKGVLEKERKKGGRKKGELGSRRKGEKSRQFAIIKRAAVICIRIITTNHSYLEVHYFESIKEHFQPANDNQ